MPELEGLQFKISTDIGDTKQIDKLIQSLQSLKGTIKIDIGFGDSAKQLQALSKKIDNFNLDKLKSIAKTDVSGLTSGISAVSEAVSRVPTEQAEALKKIVDTFHAPTQSSGLDARADELSKLIDVINKADSGKATAVAKLANSFRAFREIPDLFNFRFNLEKLLQDLENVDTEKATAVGKIVNSFRKFQEIQEIPDIRSSVENLKSICTVLESVNPDKITQIAQAFKTLMSMSSNAEKAAQNITAISQALSQARPTDEFIVSLELLNEQLTNFDNFSLILLQNLAVGLKKISTVSYRAIPEGFIDSLDTMVKFTKERISSLTDHDFDTLYSFGTILQEYKGLGTARIDENFPASLGKIIVVMRELNENEMKRLTTLAQVLKGFSTSQNIKISPAISKNLTAIKDALKALTDDDIKRLKELASAMKILASSKSPNIKMTINTGEIQAATQAVERLGRTDPLASLMQSLQRVPGAFKNFATNAVDAFKNLRSPIGLVIEAIKQLEERFHILENGALLFRLHQYLTFEHLPVLLQNALHGLRDIFRPVAQAFRELVDGIKEKWIELGGTLPKVIANVASKIANSTFGRIFIQPLVGVGKLIGAFWKLGSELQILEHAANGVKFIFKNMFVAPLKGAIQFGTYVGKKMLSPIMRAAKQLQGVFLSFSKVLRARLFRSILSSITSGFKEGIDNLYQYSKTFNGEFAQSMDTFATSMLYFKNSIAAAVAPIINRLAPALDIMIDKIVEAINVLNQFNAKITGASTWTKALKYPKEYAEAANDAKDAMNSFTMGFDELNIISENSSGKSADELDYSKMFQEMELDTKKFQWVDQIKEAIENGDWYGAGELLGLKLNTVFNIIDWAKYGKELGEKINNIISFANGFFDASDFRALGSGIATFLNEGFEEISFYHLGSAIAGGFNTIIELVNGFVKEFKFTQFGNDLADIVNGWSDKIDLNMLVETLSLGLKGILDTVYTFFTDVRWEDSGAKFGEAINQIFAELPEILGKIGRTASEFAISVFTFLSSAIQTVNWQELGSNLYQSIKSLFKNIDWNKLGDSFFGFLGSAIGAAFGLLFGFFGDLATDLREALTENGEFTFKGFIQGIGKAISTIGTWIKEHIFKPFIDGFKKAFGIASPSKEMEEQGGYIISGMLGGILSALKSIGTWIKTNIFTPFIDAFKTLFGIDGTSSSKLKEQGSYIIAGLKNGITSAWTNVKEWVKQHIVTPFVTFFKNLFGIESPSKVMEENGKYITEGLKNGIIGEAWTNLVTSVSTKITEFVENWKTGFEAIKTTVSEKWTATKENVETIGSTIWETTKTGFSNFKDSWQSGFSAISETTSTKWEAVKNTISSVNPFNKPKEESENFAKSWNSSMNEINNSSSGNFDNIKNTITAKSENLFDKFKQSITEFKSSLADGLENAKAIVSEKFSAIASAISDVSTELFTSAKKSVLEFSADWSGKLGGIRETTSSAMNETKKQIDIVFSTMWKNAKSGLNQFRTIWESGFENIRSFTAEKLNSVHAVISTMSATMFDNMRQSLDNFRNFWVSGLEIIANAVSEKISPIGAKISEIAIPLWDGMRQALNSFYMDWTTGIDAIANTVSQKWPDIAETIKAPFRDIAEWFYNIFYNAWSRVKSVFSTGGDVFGGIQEGISAEFKNIVNHLIDGINNIFHNSFQTINNALWTIKYVAVDGVYPFWEIPMVDIPEIPRFASGGFPNSGDLFFANEAGYPEFVGSMGGKTAVANNDQIEQGIYQAAYQAFVDAMNSTQNTGNQSGKQEFYIYLDSRQISAKVEQNKREMGQSIFSGSVVNNGY